MNIPFFVEKSYTFWYIYRLSNRYFIHLTLCGIPMESGTVVETLLHLQLKPIVSAPCSSGLPTLLARGAVHQMCPFQGQNHISKEIV